MVQGWGWRGLQASAVGVAVGACRYGGMAGSPSGGVAEGRRSLPRPADAGRTTQWRPLKAVRMVTPLPATGRGCYGSLGEDKGDA